jgi:hypothetical protein
MQNTSANIPFFVKLRTLIFGPYPINENGRLTYDRKFTALYTGMGERLSSNYIFSDVFVNCFKILARKVKTVIK